MIGRMMPGKRRIVYEAVKGDILRGAIAPGSLLLGENSLAENFGVSRVTVRLSLAQLESDGYLSRLPRKGWKVRSIAASRICQKTVSAFVSSGISRGAVEELCDGIREGFGGGATILKNLIPQQSNLLSSEGLDLSRCDAVAYLSGTGIAPRHLEMIRRQNVPCVSIFFDARAEYDCICPDNPGATRKLVEHMLEKGRRRILMIECALNDPSFEMRAREFKSLRESLDFCGDSVKIPINFVGNDEASRIIAAIRRKKIDALICVTDNIAKFMLLHLLKAGIDVPKKVAVAGFGNDADPMETALYGIKRMTSIGYRHRQLGIVAGKAIATRIASPEMPPVKATVETELIAGDST